MMQDNLTPEMMAGVIEREGDRRWFEFGRDPRAAEIIGQKVADQLDGPKPDVVLCLEHEEDAVLAHIVARSLGATRVVLLEQEGLMWFSHELHEGSRVAAITLDPRREKPREVLFEMLRSHDAHLTHLVRFVPDEQPSVEWVRIDAQ
jgi:hypothetical protein